MKWCRAWAKGTFALVLTALALLLMIRWFEHSQVFHPSRFMQATAADLRRPFENVDFRSEDGVSLNGWFFPANANSIRAPLVVLHCHGNGGNISHRLDFAEAVLATGTSVFLFDYRGYGCSSGHPSEAGTYLDAEAAYRWLLAKGFTGNQIVVFGESLGGGVAAGLAQKVPTAGLVLQSTFTCIADIGADLFPWLPVRWLSQIKYDTLTRLPQIKVPVMVMHSREDRLIRFQHSQRNFAAANEPKMFCELAGDHNDPLTDRSQFIADLTRFLDLVARKAPASPNPSATR